MGNLEPDEKGLLSFFFKYLQDYKDGVSPLHYVAENNLKDIGEILLSKGANLSSKDIIYQIILIIFLIR